MSDNTPDFTADIDTVGTPDGEAPDHDPTNGRWLEKDFATALERCGYLTARNMKDRSISCATSRRSSP
jgi:hypothetical protein